MFGVKTPEHAPQKPVLEPPMAILFWKNAHHRMLNEQLGKVKKFGDPKSIRNDQRSKKHQGGGVNLTPTERE